MTRYEKRTQTLIDAGKLIPLAPIREAFEHLRDEGATTSTAMARHLGWFKRRSDHRGQKQADSTRFMRAIGMQRERSGGCGKHYVRQYTLPRNAEKLTAALVAVSGLDPVDLGL